MNDATGVPGKVVAVNGPRVVVKVSRHSACGQPHRCPWALDLRLFPDDDELEVEAEAAGKLAPGDSVLVITESRHVIRSWVLAFGLPLGGALGGAVAGAWLTGTDLGAAAGMGLGLAAGWWYLRRVSGRMAPPPLRAVAHHDDPCAGVCPHERRP